MADGQQSNTGQGSLSVGGFTIPLRSRKTGGGESVQALQGQSQTAQTGSLGLSRERAVTGHAATFSQGFVTPSFSSPSDWAARSAGAFFANRFASQSDVTTYREDNGEQVPAAWEATVNGDGTIGSCKFTVHHRDSTQSGTLKIPFGTNFGSGSTFWCSYRILNPTRHATQPTVNSEGDITGPKISILSHTSSSNQPWECVVNMHDWLGQFNGYHQDGAVTSVPWSKSVTTTCTSADLRFQPAVDNGLNILTGVNPDTGVAWNACEQSAARYGGLYGRGGSSNTPVHVRRGIGDWLSGAKRCISSGWITVTQRMIVGTFGQFNSRWTVWVAYEGQDYVMLVDDVNIRLGGSGPFNCLYILPYVTERQPVGRQISARTNNITGVTIHNCGLSTPTGTGKLRYEASTQKFSWRSSANTLFGNAVSFSAANGKLLRNVQAVSDRLQTKNTASVPIPGSSTFSIPVISTSGFPASGSLLAGGFPVSYTSITPTSFNGCTSSAGFRPAGHRFFRHGNPQTSCRLTQDVTFPATRIDVDTTVGFTSSGNLAGLPALDGQVIGYTSKTATSFEGLTNTGEEIPLPPGNPPGSQITTQDYLIIEVSPASLPASGIVEDDVTIAENRADTQVNVRDVILSVNSIPPPSFATPPTVPSWVPSAAWVGQDIPNSTMTNWLLDSGNPAINLPAHGATVYTQDGASYRGILADGGPAYSSKWHEMYLYGGGHAGTSTNLLAKYVLSENAARMEVVVQPTPRDTRAAEYSDVVVNVPLPSTHELFDGYHSDLKPANCHTWEQALFLDSTDEYMVPGQTADVSQRGWANVLAAPRTGGAWRADGYYPDHSLPNPLAAGVAWTNPSHSTVFLAKGNKVRKLDVATRTWTQEITMTWDPSGACASQNDSNTALIVAAGVPVLGQWRPFFVDATTLASTGPLTVTGYQRPLRPSGTSNRGVRNVRWIPHLNGWIVLVAELATTNTEDVNLYGAWELVFFQQTGASSVHATQIPTTGLPPIGRGAQRSCMVYDSVYKTLIFFPNSTGSRPLVALKVGSSLP